MVVNCLVRIPGSVVSDVVYSVAGDGAAGIIGWNVELGLGMKPEVDGRGVCGSEYIPLLLSCFSMRSTSLVILSMTAGTSNSSGRAGCHHMHVVHLLLEALQVF